MLATPESGWFNGLNGFQYKPTPSAQSWQESRQVCQSMGGDLAAEGFRDNTRKYCILYSTSSVLKLENHIYAACK